MSKKICVFLVFFFHFGCEKTEQPVVVESEAGIVKVTNSLEVAGSASDLSLKDKTVKVEEKEVEFMVEVDENAGLSVEELRLKKEQERKDELRRGHWVNKTCPSGNCKQVCWNRNCRFKCAGGNCKQTCAGTADICSFSCAGGKCKQKCSDAICAFQCAGGSCRQSKNKSQDYSATCDGGGCKRSRFYRSWINFKT